MFPFSLLFAALVYSRNYAILINTSKNYSNYRHMSDILVLNNILRTGGFSDNDILAIFPEDQIQNQRNPWRDHILFHRGEQIKYSRLSPTSLNTNYILNTLLLRHEKLVSLDENDNLLVFMCGHGKSEFIKICDMYFLFKGDLMRVIKEVCLRLSKVLLIIDTCEAESLISREDLPKNAYVVTTSLSGENAYSIEVDEKLGVAPVDRFPYELQKRSLREEASLSELFGELKYKIKNSTITFSQKENFKVGEFFMQKREESRKVYAFTL
ncbi:GPI-anchor transamidase subunit K [Pancytospora epiphaga]|nr:GPI-anchor transamidase subunit K [Pancytospora epiphaga]